MPLIAPSKAERSNQHGFTAQSQCGRQLLRPDIWTPYCTVYTVCIKCWSVFMLMTRNPDPLPARKPQSSNLPSIVRTAGTLVLEPGESRLRRCLLCENNSRCPSFRKCTPFYRWLLFEFVAGVGFLCPRFWERRVRYFSSWVLWNGSLLSPLWRIARLFSGLICVLKHLLVYSSVVNEIRDDFSV